MAGTALAAVLVSRYADVGAIGPLQDMYEPFWYLSKVSTTIAETVALLTALAGTVLPGPVRRYWTQPSWR